LHFVVDDHPTCGNRFILGLVWQPLHSDASEYHVMSWALVATAAVECEEALL
jgi:hypothetical protein